MQRRFVAPLLVVAAIAVAVENVVYFSSGDAPVASSDDARDDDALADDGESAAADDAGTASLPPVAAAAVVAHASALPSPELARNPFLTRDEADAVSAVSGVRVHRGPPSLDGTLVGRSRRVAWLDGIAMSEGDVLRGYQLLRIEADYVVLRTAARELRLALGASADGDGALAAPAPDAFDDPAPTTGAPHAEEDRP